MSDVVGTQNCWLSHTQAQILLNKMGMTALAGKRHSGFRLCHVRERRKLRP